jgi:predicted small lipoprotein YifL
MKIAQLMVLVCLAGGVLACGQKGPLMMPDAQKHKRTVPSLPSAPKSTTRPAPAGPPPATSPAPAAPPTASPSTPAPPDSSPPP